MQEEEAEQVARTRRLWAGGEHQQHYHHISTHNPSPSILSHLLHSSLPIRRSGVVLWLLGTTAGEGARAPTRSGWGQYAPPMAGSQTSMTEAVGAALQMRSQERCRGCPRWRRPRRLRRPRRRARPRVARSRREQRRRLVWSAGGGDGGGGARVAGEVGGQDRGRSMV